MSKNPKNPKPLSLMTPARRELLSGMKAAGRTVRVDPALRP